MVFKYKRKTNRAGSWTEELMDLALREINEGKISIRGASKKYGIPYATLSDHKKKNSAKKKLGRYVTVFTDDEEKVLVNYLIELDKRFYGLTKRDFCRLAFEYAESKKIEHPFKNNQAGEQWYANFMIRNPQLSLRTPESTSIARACGFNKHQVLIFFNNLKEVLDKHRITMDNVYNVDETGIQTSAKRPPKVISIRGKKQVGSISSSERGTLITSLFCCSATGKFIPPTLVFPRKKKNPRYLEGTPPGTLMLVSENGWITSQTFLEWLKFFVSSVRPSAEHKCLLILDNHVSHRSLDVLEYASINHVVILSVPPHSTHKLQPLDVAVYGPFGKYFERALDKWQKGHPAQRVTFFDIGSIFAEAYLNSAVPNNAIKGFKKTGIFDCNINVFTEVDFMPSDVTDDSFQMNVCGSYGTTDGINIAGPSGVRREDLIQATEGLEVVKVNTENHNRKDDEIEQPKQNVCSNNIIQEREATRPKEEKKNTSKITESGTRMEQSLSDMNVEIINSNIRERKEYSASNLTIQENETTPPEKKIKIISNILLIPKAPPRKNLVKRKTQRSEILTSTPIKEEIKQKENAKPKASTKQKKVSKKVFTEDLQINDKGKTKKIKNSTPVLQYPKPPKESNPDQDVTCLICGELYSNSRSREVWIQCNICQNWAHNLCTNYKTGVYICDLYKDDILFKR